MSDETALNLSFRYNLKVRWQTKTKTTKTPRKASPLFGLCPRASLLLLFALLLPLFCIRFLCVGL